MWGYDAPTEYKKEEKRMKTKSNQNSDGSRRKLLKSLAAGSGAIIAGKSLPDKWVSPVVDTVILPAHAQTSQGLYAIGDTGPCDGIVFYITNGGLNGLEAATADQGTAPWGCVGTSIPGAIGTAIGDGAANTAAILTGCGDSPIAAELASNYAGGGCTDWFLPSRDELNQLYLQRAVVGGFASTGYWSSSEFGAIHAWLKDFNSGNQGSFSKLGALRVRAVRAF